MDQSASGYAVVPFAGAVAPIGVAPGHWGEATHWAGPVGAIAFGEAEVPGMAGADGSGPGVEGSMIYRPGGLGINPRGGRTGTGI